ncbi:MAG: winged helix-turn-helix transcriptional regulator [Calditrichaeota bacterium]|nr:MAG: winged helix-turn-helix transcriptional regulator [Calditrichota bacterium]
MSEKYQIDSIDEQILEYLKADARMPYTEIAKKLLLSGGTIHQRINKMTDAGIIKGSKLIVDYKKLGYDVTTLLGIYLQSAKDLTMVVERLQEMNEVVEVYYTTGSYALFIKTKTKTTEDYYQFLRNKLQTIPEIQSTESFICLHQPVDREISLTELKY